MNQKYRVHLFNSVFIDEKEEADKGAGALLLSRLAESSNRPLDVTSAQPSSQQHPLIRGAYHTRKHHPHLYTQPLGREGKQSVIRVIKNKKKNEPTNRS